MTRLASYATLLVLALAVSPLTESVSAHELQLGDGKVSTTPRVGYLMSCRQHWGGRQVHSGPWITGDSWDPSRKPTVEGQVTWPDHYISISTSGDERIISANNLPDHSTGIFPIQRSDPAWQYDRNPNAIEPQQILLRLPLMPEEARQPGCVPMGMIGFATDGVAIYNAVDDGGIDAVAHEIQDSCSGHPQHAGQYHYHGPSPCMPNEMTSKLVGYALDGFGIYGMIDPDTGKPYRNSDLDACHGLVGPVEWNGREVSIYHYVLTEEYPYTIGCFKGTPVESGMGPGRQHRMPGPPMGRRPPPRW